MFDSRSSVRADHDDIDFFLLNKLQDFLGFTPRFDDDFDFRLFLDVVQIFIIEHPFTIFPEDCRYLVQLLLGQVTFQMILLGSHRYDVEDIENALVSFRDAEGIIEGTIRIFEKSVQKSTFLYFG